MGGHLAPRLRKQPAPADTTTAPPSSHLSVDRRVVEHRQGSGVPASTTNNHRVPQLPPKPAAPPPASTVPQTDEEIEQMAKRLKAARTAAPSVKLAPLPTAGRSTARRNIPAATAPRLPDLSAVSSEQLFLRGLLAVDVKDVRRCASHLYQLFVRLKLQLL